MARVRVIEPHGLDVDTATARLRRFLESPGVRERLKDADVRWSGRNVDIRGDGFSGHGFVTPRDVEFELELTGVLGFFASAAESELKKRLAEALR